MKKRKIILKSKKQISQEVYPHNLLTALKGQTDLQIPAIVTTDICAGIQYALSMLERGEQEILRQRFVKYKSCARVCSLLGIAPQQVKQIEDHAFKKLRHSTRINFIQYGVIGYMKKKTTEEYHKGFHDGYKTGYQTAKDDSQNGTSRIPDDTLDLPIEAMNLPVRVYNSLHHAGFERIRDIAVLSKRQIEIIRAFGCKSAAEVAKVLQGYGIKNTAWDEFLL